MGNHCSSNASWASSANQALTGVEAQISNKAENMETNVGLKFLRFMNQHKTETSAQGDEGMEFKLTLNFRICNEESPEYISHSFLPWFSAIREAVQDASFHEMTRNCLV